MTLFELCELLSGKKYELYIYTKMLGMAEVE